MVQLRFKGKRSSVMIPGLLQDSFHAIKSFSITVSRLFLSVTEMLGDITNSVLSENLSAHGAGDLYV